MHRTRPETPLVERDQPDSKPPEHMLKGPWWYSERRSVTSDQRRNVLSQLFYEGPDRVPFLSRFSALMVMAVLIAVFGLARDSGAVVIGAMLISPLTTPILGLATALVLGHPKRQLISAAIIAAATVGGIAVAVLAMVLMPESRTITADSAQLLARTEPDLLDLGIAVVAGAAGAFVLVRKEAVSALPGVAIAVALVPPLATVGMMLELGNTDLALNALLLYLTNLAGIVLSASLVMLLMGVGPRPSEGQLPKRVRLGLTTALVAAVLVTIPLAEHTRRTLHDAKDTEDAELLAEVWVEDNGLELGEVKLEGTDEIRIEVLGPDQPPSHTELATEIATELDEQVEVTVVWMPQETSTVSVERPADSS